MTIEEKSKAYDEALEKAKEMMGNTCSSEQTKCICQEIFPELVESEDERIRKDIINFLKSQLIDGYGEEWFAWLEKHKEQKPAEWSDEDKKLKEELFELISVGIEGEDHRQNYYNFLDTHLRPQPDTVSIKDAKKFGNLEYERGVKDGLNHRWKPTEEQMRVFLKATPVNLMPEELSVYNSLCTDLQKLL